MTVLGVVTARAGSKGIPGKNTRLLGGRPLIAYTIDAALASGVFDRLILSSDDEAAAEVAKDRGCEVPFMRPPELAADHTPHLPVMEHAVRWLRDREQYIADWTMILMPTSPLRRPSDIVAAVDLAVRSGADSVVSVEELPPHYNPGRAVTRDANGFARLYLGGEPVRRRPVRRQDLPDLWVFNGAIYLFRTQLLFESEPTLYGDRVATYVMPRRYSHNLDDPDDWAVAEALLAGEVRE